MLLLHTTTKHTGHQIKHWITHKFILCCWKQITEALLSLQGIVFNFLTSIFESSEEVSSHPEAEDNIK